MNILVKFRNILLPIFLFIAACSSDKDLDETENQNNSKTNLINVDETKKRGIVLVDDNGKLGELFKSDRDELGSVNKYIWQASLEVLNFLPINSTDPFSGIIVFGKGKAPGSSQIYDATIYVSDPALDARSLNVTVRSLNGTVSLAAKREIENAILSRARQLRLKELNL